MKNNTKNMVIALMTPTVETMRKAGISRMTIAVPNVVIQMQDGEVIDFEVKDPVKDTLETLIAWSANELGHKNATDLIERLK